MPKKTLITAALPYINNVPHLGHLVGSHLPADIYARHQRHLGKDVLFVGGSDEHGTPATVKARELGIEPQVLVDALHPVHKEIYEAFDITYDVYGRTSTAEHAEHTQRFYKDVKDNGHIEIGEEEQYYCENDELFLPDRYLSGTCPHCGYEDANGGQCEQCARVLEPVDLEDVTCALCHEEPVLKPAKQVYLKLDEVNEDLKAWIESKEDAWSPRVYGEAKKWVDEGLKPRSISRDLDWGVPIPDVDDKVFYVWFDAPIGYQSFIDQDQRGEYWEGDTDITHFLGKDNVPFHTVFWPGMLHAQGTYNKPDTVVGLSYLLYEGGKFSKSKQRGVFCHNILKEPGMSDYLRAYLAKIIPEKTDTDFSWEDFQETVENDLVGNVGNYAHRVASMAASYFDEPLRNREPTSEDTAFIENIQGLLDTFHEHIEDHQYKKAYKSFLRVAQRGNQYIQENEPWKQVKENRDRAETTLYHAFYAIHALIVVSSTYTPKSADRSWQHLLQREDTPISHEAWESAQEPDTSYAFPDNPEPMYQGFEEDELQRLKHVFSESPDLKEYLGGTTE